MDYAKIAPIMGNLWSPIAAVSSHWQGQDNAQICLSIGAASIVAERPRVITQIYKTNHSHEMIASSGAFALNFPRADQLDWIDRFGMRSGRDCDKLEGLDYRTGETGSPLFADCWGWLDCRLVNTMDGGDLTCFLAEVVDGLTISDGQPLWWRDARQRLPEEWLRAYAEKQSAEVAFSRAHMSNIPSPDAPPGPPFEEEAFPPSIPSPDAPPGPRFREEAFPPSIPSPDAARGQAFPPSIPSFPRKRESNPH